LNIVDQIEKL